MHEEELASPLPSSKRRNCSGEEGDIEVFGLRKSLGYEDLLVEHVDVPCSEVQGDTKEENPSNSSSACTVRMDEMPLVDDPAGFEEVVQIGNVDADNDYTCSHGCFLPWSDTLAAQVQENHHEAIWALSPGILQLFIGTPREKPSASDANFNEELGWEIVEAVRALEEVVDRVRPIELLFLAMAFSHLARIGAGRASRPGTIDSRHSEVEALMLKYTCLESRRSLRSELIAWCPRDISSTDAHGESPGSTRSTQGPDDTGPVLAFNVFAAFICSHAAPRHLIDEVLGGLSVRGSESPRGSKFQQRMQRGLEETLGPLLCGVAALAGDASSAARRTRNVARCAAALALQGSLGSPAPSPKIQFFNLHDKAAILGRIIMMHLTGDLRRWRGCAVSSRSRSLGGG